MPPTIGGIGIDPQGQPLVVTITPSAKVYLDAAGSQLASFPLTLAGRTSFYVSAAQQFTVSVLFNGSEVAGPNGQPVVVQIDQGQFEWIAPTVDQPGEATPMLAATFAPLSPVRLLPVAECWNVQVLGVDKDRNKVYAQHVAQGSSLLSCDDWDLGRWKSLPAVTSGNTWNGLWVTAAADVTITDAVLTVDTTGMTSATAAFDDTKDRGRTVTGTGIPAGTTIVSVTNATTVVLSAKATASGSGVSVTIVARTAGNIIAHVTQSGTNKLITSTDGGQTFTTTKTLQAAAGALRRSFAQLPNGKCVHSEYVGSPYPDFDLWLSKDAGATWASCYTVTGLHGHCHGVFSDPYVTNRLWGAFGDTDTASHIAYTDDLASADSITNWTTIGSGDQTWRTVDLLFTPTKVLMAADSPLIPEAVLAWDRVSGTRTTLLTTGGLTMYYGATDGTNWFWTPSSRTDNDGFGDIKTWTGRLDNIGTAHEAFVTRAMSSDVARVEQRLYGPMADGSFVQGIENTPQSGNNSAVLYRHVVTTAHQHTKILTRPYDNTRSLPAEVYGGVNPALYTTELTSSANRGWMTKLPASALPDRPFLAASCYLFFGTAIAGNVTVLVLEDDTSGKATRVRGMTSTDAVAASGSQQAFTFTRRPLLIPTHDYFVVALFSAGGCKMKGIPPNQGNISFSDGVSNSTTTYTSATAVFTGADVGRTITGTNIPASTTIASVTNGTTIVLSQAATGSGSGLSFTITSRLTQGWNLSQLNRFDSVTLPLADPDIWPQSAANATINDFSFVLTRL